jgi:lipopolysaccharide/colanic/teichoic acid biosynthesis glycosyltransferase
MACFVTAASKLRTAAMLRVVDFVLALTAIIMLLPLLIIVGCIVYVSDPGPILFGHKRIGRNCRTFRCLKFRSMMVDAEARLAALLENDPELRAAWDRDHKLPIDPRITRVGLFLRKSSLDELPQLWNVLVGEMSMVGPRPIVEAEVRRYGRYIVDYYGVRPGITGLWQISGRNDTSYRRRIALDVAFSRSLSLKLYFRILVMTLPAVVLARKSY